MSFLTHGRLPKNVYPTHYDLCVTPNFSDFTFDGNVTINVNFDNFTGNKFALHSKNLTIDEVKFDYSKMKFEIAEEDELLIIEFSEPMVLIGSYILTIKFHGVLNNDLKGFYKSTYNQNGIEKYIATTQFEATDARRAFPCFDEPNFKATFGVSIVHQKDKTVLSNCNVEKVEYDESSGLILTSFETTPLMSTYLVAFIVGDFEYIEKLSKHGIAVKVYGTEGNKKNMDFALNVAADALDWYENWFGVKYPLPKLDLIGIPDFDAGAMENWGLITFRPELLFCTKDTELSYKRDIVITIAHELAHQWFGNLVTMEWWTYLWLNESMATYFGWLVCHELFPEWNVWSKFVDSEYNYALELDSLDSSHAIEIHIENAKDINQIFDGISYCKGSCLVRSLAMYLGDEEFRKGMQLYITKNAWKNSVSKDLWDAFDELRKPDQTKISVLMDKWTKQKGYPYVTVSSYDKSSGAVLLNQHKYLKSGPNSDSTLWLVPINVTTTNDEYTTMFDTENTELKVEPNTEFIVNPNRYGFYRVLYKNKTFDITNLSINMQKQILGDEFALALSGYQKISDAFKLMANINLASKDYNLWNTVITNVSIVKKLLNRTDGVNKNFDAYISKHIVPYAKSLFDIVGWKDVDGETSNSADLRPLLISFLSLMNDESTIKYAKESFSRNECKYIMDIVGKHASDDEYSKLLDMLDTVSSDNPQLKDEILSAIANSQNHEHINKTINHVLLDKIREQDIWGVIYNLSGNHHATSTLWTFFKDNWKKLLNIYKPGSSGLSYMLKGIAVGFCSNKELEEYRDFFRVRPEGTSMVVDQTIEKLHSKIATIQRLLDDTEFLELIRN